MNVEHAAKPVGTKGKRKDKGPRDGPRGWERHHSSSNTNNLCGVELRNSHQQKFGSCTKMGIQNFARCPLIKLHPAGLIFFIWGRIRAAGWSSRKDSGQIEINCSRGYKKVLLNLTDGMAAKISKYCRAITMRTVARICAGEHLGVTNRSNTVSLRRNCVFSIPSSAIKIS